MGVMHRAEAREEQRRIREKFAGAVVVAAAVIVAVRLSREDIRPSERVHTAVVDAVALAWFIVDRVLR